MKNRDDYTSLVIKDSYRELIYKIITSVFIRGLLLIIPVFWSNAVNRLSDGNYSKTYSKKYMKTFKNKINILCEFPYIGVLTDYDTTVDVDIRKIIVGRYSVYYMFL